MWRLPLVEILLSCIQAPDSTEASYSASLYPNHPQGLVPSRITKFYVITRFKSATLEHSY